MVFPRFSQAEPISLGPANRSLRTQKVEVALQIGGDLLLHAAQKAASAGTASPSTAGINPVPMNVTARLVYDEAPLPELAGKRRSLRLYQAAKAVATIDKGEQKPELAAEHRWIMVENEEAELTLASPGEQLSREELDLIDTPANTLVLNDLLPSDPVELGASWRHADTLLASLLRLDAVSLCDVQSMLAEVDAKTNTAKISMAGLVQGGIGGVSTEIELKAKYTVDLKAKQITSFALLVKEKRSVGTIGPGLDIVAKQIVKISPTETSPLLAAAQAKAASVAIDDAMKSLRYTSPDGQFSAVHERRWYTTTDDKKRAVFRFVDRGELVGQANVTLLDAKEKPTTLAEFQKDIERTLGERFGQFEAAKESTDSAGRNVLRVVATGKVSELPIRWVYYLLTHEDGRRMSVSFTMESSLAERFGAADQPFIAGLKLAAPMTANSNSPTPATR